MSNTTPVIPGYWQDGKGRLVPEAMVKDQDKLEDQTVRKIIGYATELSAQIARFKGHTFEDIETFLDILSERYGAKRGGSRGNTTLTTYDQLMKVEVKIQDRWSFGPSLQVAKQLVDQCLNTWAEGARAEIRAIVTDAFQVDQHGTVNREALLRLRKLPIEDETWKQAMEALNESIRMEGSKAYLRFSVREHTQAAWSAISIDLAAVDAPAPAAPVAAE